MKDAPLGVSGSGALHWGGTQHYHTEYDATLLPDYYADDLTRHSRLFPYTLTVAKL